MAKARRQWIPYWQLPLLTKELIEQAQRRRTFVLRISLATLGYFLLIFFNYSLFVSGDLIGSLGRGRNVLNEAFQLELTGIYLVMPAIAAVSIVQEKERNTLSLLFLTRLSPTTILFEKFASLMCYAGTFLLIGIPPMALAFPLGGITLELVGSAVGSMLLSVMLVIAIGLFSSTWCRTSVGAVLLAYFLVGMHLLGPVLLYELVGRHLFDNTRFYRTLYSFYPLSQQFWMPANLYWAISRSFAIPGSTFFPFKSVGYLLVFVHYSVPSVIQIVVFLLGARLALVRRAELSSNPWLLKLFRRLDAWFERMNQNRWTRGAVLVQTHGGLPDCHPIAWRETTRAFLSTPAHLVRLSLGLGTGIIFLSLCFATSNAGLETSLIVSLLVMLLFLVVKGAALIPGERSRQTLDVLMVTPIASRQVLREKMAGVWRLYVVLATINLILLGIVAWVHPYSYSSSFDGKFGVEDYAIWFGNILLTILVYAPLAIWISIAIGMRVHRLSHSVIWALGVIAGWALIPMMIFSQARSGDSGLMLVANLLGPTTVFGYITKHARQDVTYSLIPHWMLNFLYYSVLFYCIRLWCLRRAPVCLGRLEQEPIPSPPGDGSRDAQHV